jgi:hypothetical protein
MFRTSLPGLLVPASLAAAAMAQTTIAPAAKRALMQAVIVDRGPEIDGTLKSPVWQAVMAQVEFALLDRP